MKIKTRYLFILGLVFVLFATCGYLMYGFVQTQRARLRISYETRDLTRLIAVEKGRANLSTIIQNSSYAEAGWVANDKARLEDIGRVTPESVIIAYKDCGPLGYVVIDNNYCILWRERNEFSLDYY